MRGEDQSPAKAVVGTEWFEPSPFSAAAVVGRFAFLMMASAILHIVGALSDRAYMHGYLIIFRHSRLF